MTSQTTGYFATKSSVKFAKFGCNFSPISQYRLYVFSVNFHGIINEFEKTQSIWSAPAA